MRRGVAIRRAAAGAAIIAAWSLVAWGAARALWVESDLSRADVIVVLGGSAAYSERARHAARLYAQGRAPRILLTNDGGRGGWSQTRRENPLFVERAREELLEAGVPASGIEVLEPKVSSTYAEAILLRDYAASSGTRSMLIVTSRYHSRRASWVFNRVMRESNVRLGLSAAPASEETPRPATWWLTASGWRQVGAEYPKLLYYRINY